jgi:hypothetical protein
MLTFEEFFNKKKIDLQQLQQAEPALFAEFSKHYPLMGEKSFDHTKKYWFNNLRRTYPLAQAVKPHNVQAEAISQTATQGIAVAAAQNLNEAIERPKFKEDNLPDLVEENVPEKDVSMLDNEILIVQNTQEISGEPSTPKPAFKPRFNPKNIKKPDVENASESPAEQVEPTAEPTPKPVFKPRFNMQNIKKDAVKTATEAETEVPQQPKTVQESTDQPEETPAKPAFKPRFKMQNIKAAAPAENPPAENANTVRPELSAELPQPETGKEDSAAAEPPAKPAYKPRFQMKNVKPQESETKPETPEPTAAAAPKPATESPQPATEPIEDKEAKPAYKPRFQMKNVKPQESEPKPKIPELTTAAAPKPATENPQLETEPTENKEAKPAYKPRFQMKNIPKPPASE